MLINNFLVELGVTHERTGSFKVSAVLVVMVHEFDVRRKKHGCFFMPLIHLCSCRNGM